MNLEIYPFDTIECQSSKEPYRFEDFDSNFFNIYLERRETNIKHLRDSSSSFEVSEGYSLEELKSLLLFETSKITKSFYHELNKNRKLEGILLEHFWKILKKADLRKLTGAYDSDFKNAKKPFGLENHALLALTFGMFSQTNERGYLQALSTSMKKNDFLLSRINELVNYVDRGIVLTSLELEKDQVINLRNMVNSRSLDYVSDIYFDKIEPPTIIKNLGMLLQEGNRSKAYLQALINSGLYPNFVLFLQNTSYKGILDNIPDERKSFFFNPKISEIDTLEDYNIPHLLLKADSCNSLNVIEELKKASEEFFVFSGRGILKEVLDVGKKIIHVHSGKLPYYRGSTCHVYSVLAENEWYCTSFLMKPEIDQGEIITSKRFPLPNKNIDYARIYDPYTRSMVLVDTVKQLSENKSLKTSSQNLSEGIDYYLIHPVLEFIRNEYLDNLN